MMLVSQWRVEWTERDGVVLDTFITDTEPLLQFITYLVGVECVPFSVEEA